MSPLLRRVGIYLVLSTAAVTVVNQLELDQANVYPIYIPMFIGIYVISRWIDSRFNQTSQLEQPKSTDDKGSSATGERGFGD